MPQVLIMRIRFLFEKFNNVPGARRPAALLLSLLLIPALQGCSATEGRSPLLRTSLGPALEKLWREHGGLDTWRRFSGARLQYSGTIQGKAFSLRPLLIDFRSPGKTWYQRETGGPWSPYQIQPPQPNRSETAASIEDLALGTLPLLFHLPFAIEGHEWTLRRALHAGGRLSGVEFEAARQGPDPGIGPFLIRIESGESATRGLRSAHYLCRHPALPRGPYRVEFNDYIKLNGIYLSTRREHFHLHRQKEAFLSPGDTTARPLWTENLDSIQFLSDEELEGLVGATVKRTNKG
jgi:hypothetical protein